MFKYLNILLGFFPPPFLFLFLLFLQTCFIRKINFRRKACNCRMFNPINSLPSLFIVSANKFIASLCWGKWGAKRYKENNCGGIKPFDFFALRFKLIDMNFVGAMQTFYQAQYCVFKINQIFSTLYFKRHRQIRRVAVFKPLSLFTTSNYLVSKLFNWQASNLFCPSILVTLGTENS